jgi:hypothetical protein
MKASLKIMLGSPQQLLEMALGSIIARSVGELDLNLRSSKMAPVLMEQASAMVLASLAQHLGTALDSLIRPSRIGLGFLEPPSVA